MPQPIPEEKIWELLGWPQDVAPDSMFRAAFPPIVELVRNVEHYHNNEDPACKNT